MPALRAPALALLVFGGFGLALDALHPDPSVVVQGWRLRPLQAAGVIVAVCGLLLWGLARPRETTATPDVPAMRAFLGTTPRAMPPPLPRAPRDPGEEQTAGVQEELRALRRELAQAQVLLATGRITEADHARRVRVLHRREADFAQRVPRGLRRRR